MDIEAEQSNYHRINALEAFEKAKQNAVEEDEETERTERNDPMFGSTEQSQCLRYHSG